MSSHVSYEIYPQYLRAKLLGVFPPHVEVFETIRDQARKCDRSRIVFDLLDVDLPVSDLYRFWAGKTVADVFEHRFKIAALVREDQINRSGENAAVNRGARLFVTADEESALRWLIG